MSNHLRPWRRRDKKHLKHKPKKKFKKPLLAKTLTIDDTPWDVKLDIR